MKRLLGCVLLITVLVGCEKDSITPYYDDYKLTLDGRLDTTNDGLYVLEMNPQGISPQVIHRISGQLLNHNMEPQYPQKVEWESSHYWVMNDTTYAYVKRRMNLFGDWVNTRDTVYVTGFGGTIVPTINPASYSGTNGEINTMIAPIPQMTGDTMIIVCKFQNIKEEIKIILK
jgi:hypothetical protein